MYGGFIFRIALSTFIRHQTHFFQKSWEDTRLLVIYYRMRICYCCLSLTERRFGK
ncbi:hypothetical protein B0O99DRAFT_614826 [Bisporella sp. PMI_857]|nr:hypothetical protein B0O99DRAFT_614826 [Bisporella sp. PMI_857]